jgi:regulator of RNase E activity RraA
MWGEVNSTIFRSFGGIGVITNGCVRDLDEMRAKPFHAFAASVGVSHANIHVVDVGVTVRIGGLDVSPGELLHADQHGVISIPLAIAEELPGAVRKVEEGERGVIDMFSAPDFDPHALIGDVKH